MPVKRCFKYQVKNIKLSSPLKETKIDHRGTPEQTFTMGTFYLSEAYRCPVVWPIVTVSVLLSVHIWLPSQQSQGLTAAEKEKDTVIPNQPSDRICA